MVGVDDLVICMTKKGFKDLLSCSI